MVKVWWKFKQNQAKATWVTEQNLKNDISVKITKWHNSYNTDPSAPFSLQSMQCLMVKVWWKFKQNQAKANKSYRAKSQKWYLLIKITKWHNSFNIDPSAPSFLQNMQCLMVKVWWKFKQNQAKATRVIEQNLKNDIF